MPFPLSLNPVVRRRLIFLALLGVLHLIFLQGPDTQLGRLLLLAHIGIGLIWQPFVQPRRGLGLGGTFLVILSATFFAYYLNWAILMIWVMLLTGVVGGKVIMFHDRWERLFHLLALGYLVTVALALILPQSLRSLNLANPDLVRLVLYLSPTVFIAMAALPVGGGVVEDRAEIVDYVYGVITLLLLSVIVLGSLSFALIFKTGYVESLLTTLALMSGILLLLGFIWDPRAGFGGLGSAVAQHVMSLGLPIEDWLQSLAELARGEEDHEALLARACAELPERLVGVKGVRWEVFNIQGQFGEEVGYTVAFSYGLLRLWLVTNGEPSPTVRWHYDLVVRLLAEIHLGKWRAQELKRLSYIEAVHQTGARLTHDVKNLLQSLDSLCLAAEAEGAQPSVRFNELLRRQLPEISARLRQTLAKLSAPVNKVRQCVPMPGSAWFESLRVRYTADWLQFEMAGTTGDCSIPDGDVFSSIIENLLQNIVDKRRVENGVVARVRFALASGLPVIEVCDSGSAVPEQVAVRLFQQRIGSENGLGIGLYQCASMAASLDYSLSLSENRQGEVCFRLSPANDGPIGRA